MYAPVRNALELVGNKHKYQYLITLLLFCFNYFANFISIGGTLIFMNPSFRCSFSPDIVDESLACQRISECEITSDYTIVASMELYCDQQFQRNAVQSVSAIGSIIGLLIINYISDHKGRKVSILILQIVAILGFAITIIGAEYKYIILLLIGQFLCGFSSYSMVLSTYILPSQFCQEIFRQRAVVAVNYAWSLTFILLGILYYFCNYWQVFLLYFCLIPLIVVCIITYFFMVQGPNYLYSQNKIQQCRDSLKFIAKINGRQVQYEQAEKLIVHRELEDHQKNSIFQAVRILFKNKKYIKLLLVLTALQFGGNTYYYGGNYALDLIGYELGTNLIAAGIIQILGFATLNMVIEKVPRKKAIIICYTILASLGFLFIIPEVRESLTGQAVILGIARYLITMAYLTIIITLTESFPMKVQSICSGFVQSLAQLGIFAGPIVVTLCINLQIYPLIVFSGILVIFVVIPAFGLEQTLRNEKQKTQLGLLVDQKEGQQ